ncbi:hypothetical protein [Anaeroselena agilis]|uniref:Uncharacterized protein n=1 Tax=Anaeroselena agilis TaxID=3063788 RepID=A0ABU3NWD6_9FIRM|nr:hypothetical protein [Selenomonadales bacterium 4137-cl]MDT8901868.1 hypothetical protein [Selenomonadales bacterium 4137-cl]
MDSDFKYTLIVSQFYHSYHMFIVKFDTEMFLAKAKLLTEDLESYKRVSDEKRDYRYGDLDYYKDSKIRRRYNVNDQGDIYFINHTLLDDCLSDSNYYRDESKKASRGYTRVLIKERIYEHHNYGTVKALVQKHFEIA